MRVILFTPPSNKKILDGTKTLTARCWRQKPPKYGEVVRAQTGRKKETTFAYLRIVDVWKWDGKDLPRIDGFPTNDSEMQMITKKEGFSTWGEFYDAYHSLNAWCWDDPKRTHYFIGFKVIDEQTTT